VSASSSAANTVRQDGVLELRYQKKDVKLSSSCSTGPSQFAQPSYSSYPSFNSSYPSFTPPLTVFQLNQATSSPPSFSSASGQFIVKAVQGDGHAEYATNTLFGEVFAHFLSSNVTAAHIHGPANASSDGPVVATICAATASVPCSDVKLRPDLPPDRPFWWTQFLPSSGVTLNLDMLKNGMLYLNIHTLKNPAGELRGQLVPWPPAASVPTPPPLVSTGTPGNASADPSQSAAPSLASPATAALSEPIRISAGNSHTCALTSSGAAKCWGVGSRLGNGGTSNALTPVDVSGMSSGVVAISAGSLHTCALTSSGAAKCWGDGNKGQLGNGGTNNALTPVDVSGMSSGVVAVSAGGSHTCALTSSGAAKCWGASNSGQLGNGGTDMAYTTPVNVSGMSFGVVAISAGQSHTCALTSSGAAKCWGDGGKGQLGNGVASTSLTPVDVSGLSSGVVAISVGLDHTCALTSSGAAKCWGFGLFSVLGNGGTGNALTPVDVSGLSSGMVAISAGEAHTCALTSSGAAKCWGTGMSGQLGNGGTNNALTPVDVSGMSSGAVAISAGGSHTCALTSSGAAKCWGANFFGQLGNGRTDDSFTPVNVQITLTP
jgi:alpha-tubulin suppressor-like RCC1 family protein